MIGVPTRIAALGVLLGVLSLSSVAFAATKIGVASATQNDVQGISGGSQRSLAAGSQIFQDETIRTGAKAMAQLLFLDETSLSVGPQSEVTLDRFVYNPSTGTGDVVLSATRGAFRFITGSQNPTNYQLKTAIATIGVRGTVADGYVTPRGLYLISQEGKVIVTVNGVVYTLLPGQALFVAPNGAVSGPMVPDGLFFRVTGVVPFTLYGSLLPGDRDHFTVPDGATVRTDEFYPQVPPDDDDDECGDSGCDYVD
jgi:hypothetical protein